MRSFVKSDNGYVAALAQRMTGSPDVYGKDVREPEQSVNFVTVHGETSHSLAVSRHSPSGLVQFFFMINAYWEPLKFQAPPRDPGKNGWRVWIDTSQPSPHDIYSWSDAPPVLETTYVVSSRSIVVLAAD